MEMDPYGRVLLNIFLWLRGERDGGTDGSYGELSKAASVCLCWHEMIVPSVGSCHPGLRRMVEFSMKDVGALKEFVRSWCGQLLGSGLSDAIMREVASVWNPAITEFYLGECEDLTNKGIKDLFSGLLDRGPWSITLVDLHNCDRITDTGILWLARFHSLRSLQLNSMQGVTDWGVFHLAKGCPELRYVDLCGCSLFTVHCSLFTVHCSMFNVQCSMFTGSQVPGPLWLFDHGCGAHSRGCWTS